MARWWGREGGEGAPDGQALAGKPSVFFRKTVNAHTPDGRSVAVNAQQYAVLVMDVPDLRLAKPSCAPLTLFLPTLITRNLSNSSDLSVIPACLLLSCHRSLL